MQTRVGLTPTKALLLNRSIAGKIPLKKTSNKYQLFSRKLRGNISCSGSTTLTFIQEHQDYLRKRFPLKYNGRSNCRKDAEANMNLEEEIC